MFKVVFDILRMTLFKTRPFLPIAVDDLATPPEPGLSPDAVPGRCRAVPGLLLLADAGLCMEAVIGRLPWLVPGRSATSLDDSTYKKTTPEK